MNRQETPRAARVSWIIWLTAALLLAWIVLGFTGGWKLYEVLGTVAMAMLLLVFLRQSRQVFRNRRPENVD
ncbi:hypothetical protein [Kocuria rosea]|uniref:hypothetical protein n=1 Tax=Kocuria rosea TaxID=1275 RepID=UPI0011A1875E|nr:hypothetical protein [Kocuria rosea]